ncbi:hypothetical protein PBV87_21765 [Niameybacter massiliensis]|uniref:Uncharacterized protein n=1 Tax=Holtiella tumoricola TaxID=3018743 RepID=A0AA42DSC8_9FIRM|nr:hypothetical protein [Holtiella tumoricola]MDA3734106.1 hypothetical protein [Holtiella tumoricola]
MEGYWIIYRRTNSFTAPSAKWVRDEEEVEKFLQEVENIKVIDIAESIYKEQIK